MIRIAVVDDVCEVCTQLEKYLLQLSDKYNQEIEVEPFYSGKSICDALNISAKIKLSQLREK